MTRASRILEKVNGSGTSPPANGGSTNGSGGDTGGSSNGSPGADIPKEKPKKKEKPLAPRSRFHYTAFNKCDCKNPRSAYCKKYCGKA